MAKDGFADAHRYMAVVSRLVRDNDAILALRERVVGLETRIAELEAVARKRDDCRGGGGG